MWIVLAFGSAFFSGITAVLAKCGIKKTDPDLATAIRTLIVLIFAWVIVIFVGSYREVSSISVSTWLFLVLSGCATGASWLCYFRALQLGNINQVVPIDKCSTVLTIILAFLLLKEPISVVKFFGLFVILIGTLWMVQKKKDVEKKSKGHAWMIYAVLSALFASLTSIFGKIGMVGVESNLGTALRTCIVLIMAWLLIFIKQKQYVIKNISSKELAFIFLSGLSTGVSWLCYFKSLQEGLASVVVPIDKLGILVTMLFSYIVFKEKLSVKELLGLCCIVIGTILMI